MKRSAEDLDVDTRLLLANERTLLAWIRTSLTIEAGGVALFTIQKNHSYLGLSVLLAGVVAAFIGYHRFHAANRAIRAHRLPPEGTGPAIQVALIVVIAAGMAVAEYTVLR